MHSDSTGRYWFRAPRSKYESELSGLSLYVARKPIGFELLGSEIRKLAFGPLALRRQQKIAQTSEHDLHVTRIRAPRGGRGNFHFRETLFDFGCFCPTALTAYLSLTTPILLVTCIFGTKFTRSNNIRNFTFIDT